MNGIEEVVTEHSNELMEMLKSGVPKVVSNVADLPSVTIAISPDDSDETKAVKKNIEFTTNSVQTAVNHLQSLGEQTGNPRFFEAIATLLNTLNGANNQLMKIAEKKAESSSNPGEGRGTQAPVTNNYVVMSGREALSGKFKDITGDSDA